VKKWAILLWLFTTVAFADIGSVVDLTGTAVIKRGKETITVAKGTLVETNDKVETKNGVVNIRFKDDTTVKVTENSSLVIDDFVYDPKNAAGGKLSLKAASGTVRYVSGNIAHNNPNSVKINTPTAAIAVRGTDFVMAVDETGKSMIMLMPTCELPQVVNLKGLVCGSGKIDVDSGTHIVRLDKPYQATIVETSTMPPLPPVVVNLNNTVIGNNLLIRPPMTMGGNTIQQAARGAAEKTGDAKREKEDDKKESRDGPSIAEAKSTDDQRRDQQEKTSRERAAEDRALGLLNELRDKNVTVTDKPYENEHIVGIFKNDNPNLNQLGWGYMSLSPNGNNFTAISLTNDNKNLVVVTQDRVTDAYNFAGGFNKPQGSIIINQSYK
jgi:FecR protein